MTEEEWLTCVDPEPMLHVVAKLVPSKRKIRLFNAAVCRRFWDYLPDASKAILAESELLADGLMKPSPDRMELCGRANNVVAPFDRQFPKKQFPTAEIRIQRDAAAAVCYAVIPNELWGAVSYFWEIDQAEKPPHSIIIRDIFGNPFQHVAVIPSWRTLHAVRLAQSMYDARSFDRMSELADSLERAGCRSEPVLSHCREPGEHFRGCWVADLVFGHTIASIELS
jgi:hypothetical protein